MTLKSLDFLDDCIMDNWTMSKEGLVDVHGDFMLKNGSIHSFKEVDIKFNKVEGDFNVDFGLLKNMEGFPDYVGGNFSVCQNQLSTLVGGPTHVGGDYVVSGNSGINELIGIPKFVGGDFYVNLCYNLLSTYSGDVDCEIIGNVRKFIFNKVPFVVKTCPRQLFDNNFEHIKLIFKYQRYYKIWEKKGGYYHLNKEKFIKLIDDIKDGLE